MSQSTPQRRVVLVDDADNELGEDSVLDSHVGGGKRHRAFTAVVLDGEGRLLAAQRAPEKLLWPGHWDVTVASHPRPGEGYIAAGERRLIEEMGEGCKLGWAGRFAYDVPYADVGSENELCATLVGRLDAGQVPQPVAGEITEIRSWDPAALLEELDRRPGDYCPWLFLAFLSIVRHADALCPDVRGPLEPLFAPGVEAKLRQGLEPHFATGEWTLVDPVGSSE